MGEPLEALIKKAWNAYTDNFLSFITAILLLYVITVGLIAIGFVPLLIIFAGLYAQGLSASQVMPYLFARSNSVLLSLAFALVFMVLAIVVSAVLRGGMAAMSLEALKKKRTSWSIMFSAGRDRWMGFFGVRLLVSVITLITLGVFLLPGFSVLMSGQKVLGLMALLTGILLFIPVGVVFETLFAFVYFTVFAEKLKAWPALESSVKFGRKNFWDTLALILFFAVLSFVVGLLNAVTYIIGTLLAVFVVVPLQLLSLAALYNGRKKGRQ
jgi:hypothetical protein